MGRPAKIWDLTEKANGCFPDNHAAISLSLLQSAKAAFGPEGLCKLLAQYAKDQVQSYRTRTKNCQSLSDRLNTLAGCRTEEGYMAELGKDDDGNILFIENHCPISCAAQTCSEFCEGELNMFREILGSKVNIERTEHMLGGDRRCVYRIAEQEVLSNQ